MKRQRIHFIINPRSGIGKQKKIESLISTCLDTALFEPKISYTEKPGHAFDLAASAVEQGAEIVAIAGGDGSVNEAGKALMGTNVRLLILPLGSGNGIANHYNIPLKADVILKNLINWKTVSSDIGEINGVPFFGFCGMGFDAHIAHAFSKETSRGFWGYFRSVLKEYFRYQGSKFEFAHNGNLHRIQPFILSIANTSEYGNGVVIDEKACTRDGLLALCVVKPVNAFQLVKLFRLSRKRKISGSSHYQVFRASEFELLHNEDSTIGQIDGEPWTFTEKRLIIKVSNLKLLLLVP